MLVIECVTSRALPPVATDNRGDNRCGCHGDRHSPSYYVVARVLYDTISLYYIPVVCRYRLVPLQCKSVGLFC